MLGNLIHLIYRGLTIKRRNNYPRIDHYCESEHISLKLNIALIVVFILRDSGKKIDLLYIYKNIFWSSLFTFIYSDLEYDVKSSLKQRDITMYKTFRKKLEDFFLSLDLPGQIKKDLSEIFEEYTQGDLFEQKFLFEKDVIDFVKNIEKNIEIQNNVKIYTSSYRDIPQKIGEKIKFFGDKIGFKDYEILDSYLDNLVKVKFTQRRNRHNRRYPVSVLSHLYFVFSFSYFLALLKNFDSEQTEEILNISLLHDIPEAVTGDVITPTKKAIPGFKKLLNEIEEDFVKKYIISNFDGFDFQGYLIEKLLSPFSGDLGKIAKFSDKLSAMCEAKLENNIDNYKETKQSLWLEKDDELDYILKFGIDYFEEDIEKKRGEFIIKNK